MGAQGSMQKVIGSRKSNNSNNDNIACVDVVAARKVATHDTQQVRCNLLRRQRLSHSHTCIDCVACSLSLVCSLGSVSICCALFAQWIARFAGRVLLHNFCPFVCLFAGASNWGSYTDRDRERKSEREREGERHGTNILSVII